jgi:hypothetical protein
MAYAKDGVFYANHFRSHNNCRLLSCIKNGFDYFRSSNGLLVICCIDYRYRMMVQGLGILLPTNLRVYFELRKGNPDIPKIQKLMKKYVKVVAIQSAKQFTIIFIMAEFATGFPLHL